MRQRFKTETGCWITLSTEDDLKQRLGEGWLLSLDIDTRHAEVYLDPRVARHLFDALGVALALHELSQGGTEAKKG